MLTLDVACVVGSAPGEVAGAAVVGVVLDDVGLVVAVEVPAGDSAGVVVVGVVVVGVVVVGVVVVGVVVVGVVVVGVVVAGVTVVGVTVVGVVEVLSGDSRGVWETSGDAGVGLDAAETGSTGSETSVVPSIATRSAGRRTARTRNLHRRAAPTRGRHDSQPSAMLRLRPRGREQEVPPSPSGHAIHLLAGNQ